MADQGNLIAQGLDLDMPHPRNEAMPQHDAPVHPDWARISREHAPGRWILDSDGETWTRASLEQASKGKGKYSAEEALAVLAPLTPNSNNTPKGKGKFGKLMSQRTRTWPEVQAQQAAVGAFVLQRVGTAPTTTSSEVLGHGPYWLNHVSHIQLSGERENASRLEFGPVITVTHEIGACPQTRYFCTKTCLNAIEVDLLLQACVIVPNSAAFACYMHPQFRTLVTPPWTRHAMQRYFGHIAPQLAEMIADNPYFGRGGPLLHLSAIHSANSSLFSAELEAAQNNFYELRPQETEAWNQIIIQFPSRQYRNTMLRTPVCLEATGLADDLQAVLCECTLL